MRRQGWLLTVLLVSIVSGSLYAQEATSPSTKSRSDADTVVDMPSSGAVTPEMWFYLEEYRRYKNPKESVRRKAQFASQQRQNRLAAQRWFGISNSRPVANPIPYYASYSPSWVGSSWNPYAWSGGGSPSVVYYTASRDGR